MKKIGHRELKRNLLYHIKNDVPFIITKGAEKHLIVLPYPKDVKNIETSQLVIVDSDNFKMRETEETIELPNERWLVWEKIKRVFDKKLL